MMYNKMVEACFFFPKHVGDLSEGPGVAQCYSAQPSPGAVIKLFMHCDHQQRVTRMCFKATGNPYVIAALEWLCREMEGKLLNELPELNHQLISTQLDIPVAKNPLLFQIEGVFRDLVARMKEQLAAN